MVHNVHGSQCPLVADFYSRRLLWCKKTGHEIFYFFTTSKNPLACQAIDVFWTMPVWMAASAHSNTYEGLTPSTVSAYAVVGLATPEYVFENREFQSEVTADMVSVTSYFLLKKLRRM
jgi:hypothetical protein